LTDDMSFDLDGDGVPDVVIKDTNGATAYINLTTMMKWVAGCASTIAVVVVGFMNL